MIDWRLDTDRIAGPDADTYVVPRVSAAIALVGGLVVLGVSLPAIVTTVLAIGGLGLLGLGLWTGRRRIGRGGTIGLFGATLLGGLAGVPPLPLLLSTGGVIVAWESSEYAITLGTQLNPTVETTRIEVVHTGATSLIAVVAVGGSYGVFRVMAGTPPTIAVLLFPLATLLVLATLRRVGQTGSA